MPDETHNIVQRFRQAEAATREKIRASQASDILAAVANLERLQTWARDRLGPKLEERSITLQVEHCHASVETHRLNYERAIDKPSFISGYSFKAGPKPMGSSEIVFKWSWDSPLIFFSMDPHNRNVPWDSATIEQFVDEQIDDVLNTFIGRAFGS